MMEQFTLLKRTNRATTRYQEEPHYAEGLYELGHDCFAWLVPNGSWGEANAGLIVGKGESLLVDTLWDVNYTREMLTAMEAIIGAVPLKYTVNTHADGDHFFGNELVSHTQIITSNASYAEMQHTKPQSMQMLGRVGKMMSAAGKVSKKQAEIGHWFQQMVKPYAFEAVQRTLPTCYFTGEMMLEVGGRAVQLLEVGPAHTQGDALVYVPDAKVLFAADILFVGVTPVMWAGPVENWLAALDKILALDATIIVPGHGPITNKGGVQAVKDYWEYFAREATSRFEQGMSAEEAATDIALSLDFAQQPFAEWNSPERIMVSTHTHFRHLQGKTDAPKVPELINILRKQAALAHKLPNAQPQVMRKGRNS